MPTGHSPGRCSASYPLPFSTARTISITTAMPSTQSLKSVSTASPSPSVSQIRSSAPGASSQPRYLRDRFRPPCYRKGLWAFLKEVTGGLLSWLGLGCKSLPAICQEFAFVCEAGWDQCGCGPRRFPARVVMLSLFCRLFFTVGRTTRVAAK